MLIYLFFYFLSLDSLVRATTTASLLTHRHIDTEQNTRHRLLCCEGIIIYFTGAQNSNLQKKHILDSTWRVNLGFYFIFSFHPHCSSVSLERAKKKKQLYLRGTDIYHQLRSFFESATTLEVCHRLDLRRLPKDVSRLGGFPKARRMCFVSYKSMSRNSKSKSHQKRKKRNTPETQAYLHQVILTISLSFPQKAVRLHPARTRSTWSPPGPWARLCTRPVTTSSMEVGRWASWGNWPAPWFPCRVPNRSRGSSREPSSSPSWTLPRDLRPVRKVRKG